MRGFKSESILLIVFSSFLFLGLVFFTAGLLMYNSNKTFDAGDVGTTMATITDIDTYITGDDKKYDVYITYNVNGVDYNNELGSYSSSMKIGKEVEITYKLNDPSNMRYPMGDLVIFLIFGSLGGFFVIFGLVGNIIVFRKKRNIKMLLEQGVQIIGVISEVIQDRSIAINGRHPYRIIATVLNPKTNEILEASSDIYKNNPFPYVEIGSEITIYADLDKNKGVIKDIPLKNNSAINKDWVGLGD